VRALVRTHVCACVRARVRSLVPARARIDGHFTLLAVGTKSVWVGRLWKWRRGATIAEGEMEGRYVGLQKVRWDGDVWGCNARSHGAVEVICSGSQSSRDGKEVRRCHLVCVE
jgi:hypothetical protein